MQRYIEDPLSEAMIRGHLGKGSIEVYLDTGTLAYREVGEANKGSKLVCNVQS